MLRFLIKQIDYLLGLCKKANNLIARKCFYDQAFGALQYHVALFPGDHAEAESLWNDYRVQFEELVYSQRR
jgi:hypothetical protein